MLIEIPLNDENCSRFEVLSPYRRTLASETLELTVIIGQFVVVFWTQPGDGSWFVQKLAVQNAFVSSKEHFLTIPRTKKTGVGIRCIAFPAATKPRPVGASSGEGGGGLFTIFAGGAAGNIG